MLLSLLCVLLGAAVYYTASAEMLLALSAAAAVHELSHLAEFHQLADLILTFPDRFQGSGAQQRFQYGKLSPGSFSR